MCGIGGIHRRDGAAADEAALRRMADALRHRGPDAAGVLADGPLGLAHTRLSILDLSEAGGQPMRSEDGRYAVAYNGEIYNHRELRGELEARGRRFRGHSDTEVALRAWMEWGTDAFARFEGMFALALWDGRERRLQLARDRFGIKPLCYRAGGDALVFGSGIPALLASGEVPARTDWAGLHEFLHFGAPLGERTILDGVRNLPPGCALTLDGSGLRVAPYASIFDAEEVRDDLPTAVRRVRGLLERAVRAHLVSDVPVGVFLSGGIDSSAITAFASKHYGGRLRTFTAGFGAGEAADELPAARATAGRFGTDHHELHVSAEDAGAAIERAVRRCGAPFGDPALIPLYLIYEQLGGDPKVILQGDGGDEIHGGYRHYALESRERRLRLAARLSRRAGPLVPRRGGWRRRWEYLQALYGGDPAVRLARTRSSSPPGASPARVFAPEARRRLEASDPFRRYREHYRRFASLAPVQRALYTDCAIVLPDLYFAKVDMASMAHGVEARVPMADARLAAYAMGLPASRKVRGGQGKRVLRRALRGVLPDEILDRPKTGLSLPVARWLRTSLAGYMRSVLLDGPAAGGGLFDRPALEDCIERHLGGREDHAKLLYALIQLAVWREAHRPQD